MTILEEADLTTCRAPQPTDLTILARGHADGRAPVERDHGAFGHRHARDDGIASQRPLEEAALFVEIDTRARHAGNARELRLLRQVTARELPGLVETDNLAGGVRNAIDDTVGRGRAFLEPPVEKDDRLVAGEAHAVDFNLFRRRRVREPAAVAEDRLCPRWKLDTVEKDARRENGRAKLAPFHGHLRPRWHA